MRRELPAIEVAVICAFEALGGRYRAGSCDCGLNLSVGVRDAHGQEGVLGDDPQLRALLKPWTWRVESVHLWSFEAGAPEASRRSSGRLLTPSYALASDADKQVADALGAHLGSELDRLAKSKAFSQALGWQWRREARITREEFGHPWHVVVAQAARYPAPLPQLLNLSMIARAPGVPAGAALVAAPAFHFDWNGESVACVPRAEGPCSVDEIHSSWPYRFRRHGADSEELSLHGPQGEELGLRLTAFVNRDEAPAPRAGSGGRDWSGEPGWIPARAEDACLNQDWRPTLELRLSEGFDLAQRLIDWTRADLERLRTAGQKELAERLRALRQCVLATLYDLANPGLLGASREERKGQGRGEPMLAEELLAAYNDSVKSPSTKVSKSAEELRVLLRERTPQGAPGSPVPPPPGPYAAWSGNLPRYLPELAGLPILNQAAGESPEQAALQSPEKELADLDQLQSFLAHEDSLRKVVLAQWRQAFGGHPQLIAYLRDVALPKESLRTRLAMANLDATWGTIVERCQNGRGDAAAPERACLQEAIVAGLQQFARNRLGRTPPPGYGLYLQPPAALPADFVEQFADYLGRWGRQFAAHLLLLDLPEERLDAITPVPHGVTFPVGGFAPDADSRRAQGITGFGTLLRHRGKRTWRCLNMAAVTVEERTLGRAAVVPAPLHSRNGLSGAFVTYDNQPLMAASSAQLQLTHAFPFKATTPAAGDAGAASRRYPWVTYDYPLPDPAGIVWGLLPALVFRDDESNQEYEALAFTVSNSGALPAELADPDEPTRPRPAEKFAAEFDAARFEPFLRHFAYQRRVPIGEVRVEGASNDCAKPAELHLPEVPATVLPLAREVLPNPFGDPAAAGDARAGQPRAGEERRAPLLLLNPWSTSPSFGFQVRKPAVDLETWDRWVGLSGRVREIRAEVRSEIHFQASRREGSDRGAAGSWLDDPAVSGLLFELLWIDDQGGRKVEGLPIFFSPRARLGLTERTESVPPADPRVPAGPELLCDLRAPAVKVTCKASSEAPAQAPSRVIPSREQRPRLGRDSTGQGVEVVVPPGELVELRVHAVVASADAGRLAPQLRARGRKLDPRARAAGTAGDELLFSAFSLLVEAATNEMPGVASLRAALTSRFDEASSRLIVELARRKEFKYLGRAELIREVWRWSGREVGAFCFPRPPAAETPAAGGEDEQRALENLLASWDVEGFGDRPDTDHLVVAFPRAEPQDGEPLFQLKEDLGGDPRALYYRFALRAFSRYEGLALPGPGVVESWRPQDEVLRLGSWPTSGTGESDETEQRVWHRRVVPCRRPLRIPKPAVRVVLPLTEAPSESPGCAGGPASSPGLLVVLNEQWYQVGGLVEKLGVELMSVEDPGSDHRRKRYQLGPDPILSREAADLWPEEVQPVLQEVRGPIGHTFDRSGAAPLLTATSFVLSAPQGRHEGDRLDFAWYFAKLRFKRVLAADGMVGTDGKDLESEWTRAYWVQYLPPASCFADQHHGAGLDVRRLQLEDAGQGRLRLLLGGQGTAFLEAVSRPGGEMFALFLAVTQVIQDAAGRAQERYVGIYRQDGSSGDWVAEDDHPPALDGFLLRARVLEVQLDPHRCALEPRQPGEAAKRLWEDALFPTQDDDTPARLVRCSGPILQVKTGAPAGGGR